MRIVLLLTVLVSAAVLASPSDFSKPVIVYLKSGKRIVGYIQENECTDGKLVIRELLSKAKRVINWSEIKNKQAHDLRIKLGFEVEVSKGGLVIQGHEIITKSGALFRGLLLNAKTAQRDGMYILKRFDGDRRIRLEDVREGPTEVTINALEVYKPLELYEQELKKKTPETAEDHFRLAEFAAVMGALEPAKMHYTKVLELKDRKYPEALVNRLLARIEARLANQGAEDAQREIKKLTWQKKFGKAGQLIAKFKEQYKDDEDLLKAFAKLDAELKERRQSHFTSIVPIRLRKSIKDLLAKKVREKELSLRMATNYAGGEASDENSVTNGVLILIGQKLALDPDEVLDFWKLRNKRPIHKGFYRDGTFVIIENLQDALAKAPKAPSGKGNQSKPPKPHAVKKPDGWWEGKLKARKYTQARDWLYAWWAEKSGMVELMDPKTELCPRCQGKGYTANTAQGTQGAIVYFDRCQTCYMAKKFRVVRFR